MENIEIITSVVSILAVDGKIPDQEIEFLKDLCERLNVPPNVVEDAFERFIDGESYIHVPEDEKEKRRLFSLLLEAVVADGEVAPQEREMLETVATHMGIQHQHFDHVLNILLKRKATQRQ